MPGTIKASIVELMEIPSSASSPTASVKLAMGKREFQACDKGGDFSFPLTTLRDNLIVTLHDANGNEISRANVPTISIVQKGVWDDIFSLDGGGLVRMKLQFILSEEDRKRIQDMRYSALEKKKEELVKRTYTHLETRISLSAVDLQEIIVPVKAISITEEQNKVSSLDTTQSAQLLQSASDSKGHNQEEITPLRTCFNKTDSGETSSADSLSQDVHKDGEHSSEGRAFHFTAANSNSSEETRLSKTRSISAGIIQKPIMSQESLDALSRRSVSPPSLISIGRSNSVPSTPGEDVTYKPEMKSSTTRTSSTVRKMISAFETNLTQGWEPHIGHLERSQIIRSKTRSSSQDTLVEETSLPSVSTKDLEENSLENPKDAESLYAKNQNESLHLNLAAGEKILAQDEKRVDRVSKQNFKSLNLRSHKCIDVSSDEVTLDQSSNHQQRKSYNTKRKNPDGSKSRLSETAEGTGSDKDMIESNRCLALNEGGWKSCRNDSNGLTDFGASKINPELAVDRHFQQCLFDSLWYWIYQGETRHLCITTASKQLRNAAERSYVIKKERQPTIVNLSTTEEIQMHDNTCTEVKEKKAYQTFRKSNHTDAPHFSISPQVLIAQAIKIGMIVVCGAIFISTRQRETS